MPTNSKNSVYPPYKPKENTTPNPYKPLYSSWYGHKLWQACQTIDKRMSKRQGTITFKLTFTYPLYNGLIVQISEEGAPDAKVIEKFNLMEAIVELAKRINLEQPFD